MNNPTEINLYNTGHALLTLWVLGFMVWLLYSYAQKYYHTLRTEPPKEWPFATLFMIVVTALCCWASTWISGALARTMLFMAALKPVWIYVICVAESIAVTLYQRFCAYEITNRDNKAIPVYKRIVFAILAFAWIIAIQVIK